MKHKFAILLTAMLLMQSPVWSLLQSGLEMQAWIVAASGLCRREPLCLSFNDYLP